MNIINFMFGLKVIIITSLVVFSSLLNAKVTQTISAKEYEKLEKVQVLIEAKEYAQAKTILDGMNKKKGLNNYTRAQIANFTGYYYYDQGKYKAALKQYLLVIKDPKGIPEGFYNQTFYTIAQIYFQLEDYSSALKNAKKWLSTTDEPPADAFMLVGQAYYMLNEYKKALPMVEKGIAMYESSGKPPKENWLVLLRGIYYENSNNKKMLPVVEKLLKYYPKSEYMLALAATYSNLGHQKKMLAILEAMYEKGLLDEKENQILNLANLYLSQHAPYKSALILSEEMDKGLIKKSKRNYLLLAQAYLLSKDYELSLKPMEKAASLSKNSDDYFNLGQSYLYLGRVVDAEHSFKKALSLLGSAGPKKKMDVQLALGMALIEQKKFTEGEKLFKKVIRDNPKQRQAAQWLSYIASERNRMAMVDAPVTLDN